MFEVGFSEILIIFGLALIVLGPEKLPKLAAQLGRWTGRARAMARQLKAQLDEEVTFQEQRAQHGRGETPSAASSEATQSPPAASEPVVDEAPATPTADTDPQDFSQESSAKPNNE